MESAIEIGRIRRDQNSEIVIRKGEFMGKSYIDIREFFRGETFQGFTKRGIRIPEDLFPALMEKLRAI